MKAVIQRVLSSDVKVDGTMVGKIQNGLMVLLGVEDGDNEKDAEKLANKIVNLRIFEDDNGKMNLSLLDVEGEMLIVSQFTLLADCTHGRRPSFIKAGDPKESEKLYEYFCEYIRNMNIKNVATGIFGADMKVSILNDGPVTIIIDSRDLS